MKALVISFLFTLLASSTFAQLSFKNSEGLLDTEEKVEIVIVRNAEECLGYESSIYELIDGEREKVAFLYHDLDQKNAASNFHNINTIREVLNDLSSQGFQISSTKAENMDQRCNRSLYYTLVRSGK